MAMRKDLKLIVFLVLILSGIFICLFVLGGVKAHKIDSILKL